MAVPAWFLQSPLAFVTEVTSNGFVIHPNGPHGSQDVISFDSKADFIYWITSNTPDPNAA